MLTTLFYSVDQAHAYKDSWTSYMSIAKIMIFGRNKRKLNQEAYYLENDQIKITYEYKCLGVDFYSHGYFEPSSKRWGIADMKALIIALRKEAMVGITCWKL